MNKTSFRPPKNGTDLAGLFNVAAKTLLANQSSLNQADAENQNHGDNMVQTFKMISKAMTSQRGAPPSQQLQHASEYLTQNATSGSGQIYAQSLAQAAQQFQGQSAVTPDNAMMLIQSLLGSGQQSSQQSNADLVGSLLGGQQVQQTQGIDLAALLSAGMTFMSAKQQGQDTVQAALTALMSNGPMAQKPHRQQSGQVVANALLQAVAGMAKRR
ncbi:MAG: DAK2 domain-containing protein [Chloroflexota bacterium]